MLAACKQKLKAMQTKLNMLSLRSAAKEQNLCELFSRLEEIVPDLTDQYTTFKINNDYSYIKTRTQHAFQISMVLKTIKKMNVSPEKKPFLVVDIGDSSGAHLQYLRSILADDNNCPAGSIDFMSVNLDPVAVEKIKAKGFEAKLCRAEDLCSRHKIKADLLISFQMLEHLYDPISFLDSLSKNRISEYFVVTIPYLAQSRMGLYHIRQNETRDVFPENTHIFELSPSDWQLVFKHSGWRVLDEMIYRQYPRRSFLRLMERFWRRYDFEGFYGAVLVRDRKWAEHYKDADHNPPAPVS